MGLVVVTPPTIEPVSLDEARRFLRILPDDTAEDDDITALIEAARERAERVSGRSLITRTLQLTLDVWPVDGVILLPYPPSIAITSVKYTDPSTGTLTTIDSAEYQHDATQEPGVLMPAYGESWPSSRPGPNSIRVEYTAGYGATADAVPREIRERIKNYVAYCFEHRADRDESFLDSLFQGFTCGNYA